MEDATERRPGEGSAVLACLGPRNRVGHLVRRHHPAQRAG